MEYDENYLDRLCSQILENVRLYGDGEQLEEFIREYDPEMYDMIHFVNVKVGSFNTGYGKSWKKTGKSITHEYDNVDIRFCLK